MTNSNGKGLLHIDTRSLIAVGAGILIGLGLALQWIELLLTHFASRDGWFFVTLVGETWNMINVWLATGPWSEDWRCVPLLLVITGVAIFCSRRPGRDNGR